MEEMEFMQGEEEKFVYFKKQGQYSVVKERRQVGGEL